MSDAGQGYALPAPATGWADVMRLQEAGGWNSLAMPRRYVERAKIANGGMT